jgi:hypothetical protein
MKYPAVAASPQMSPVCPQQGGYPAAKVGFRQRGCIARPLQGDVDLRDWEEALLEQVQQPWALASTKRKENFGLTNIVTITLLLIRIWDPVPF